MQFKKIFNHLKYKLDKKLPSEKTQNLKSNRITVRNNVVLNKDSDFKTVINCFKVMGIQVKNKSVKQVEKEIDERIMANISKTISEYPEDAKINGIGEKYLEKTENLNLVMMKIHLVSLKQWLEN